MSTADPISNKANNMFTENLTSKKIRKLENTVGGGVVVYLIMKICNKCKESKPLDGFCRERRKKDGRQSKCRDCNKRYREANKGAASEYHKQYSKANRAALAEKAARYKRKRRENDPFFKLKHNIACLIRNSVANGGYTKKSQTHEILGCSYDEYYQHIEDQFTDGMSWQRMSEIHIDHRLPLSAATTEAELLALNHHRNLQPLWKSDNLAKSDSYCPKELAAYFAKHL